MSSAALHLRILFVSSLVISLGLLFASAASAASPQMEFPVAQPDAQQVRWKDTWGARRSGGRSHIGVDIMGKKMMPLIAVESGTITLSKWSNSSGNYLEVTGESGRRYRYIHLNNDTPGTDNGKASCSQVFSSRLCNQVSGSRIKKGVRVARGEVIAYMGDSGNAEWTSPHVHFEVALPSGSGFKSVNPTPYVNRAFKRSSTSAADPSNVSMDDPHARLTRLYETYFKRLPDTAGLKYWVSQLENGASMNDVTYAFAHSSEFKPYAQLKPSDLVSHLYSNSFNRAPDSLGHRYWSQLLATKQLTLAKVGLALSNSNEMRFRHHMRAESVTVWMRKVQRVPTPPEITHWTEKRRTTSAAETTAALVR